MSSEWFEVNRVGLRKLLRQRGLHRMVEELLSNCMDEQVTTVKVGITPTDKHLEYELTVEDDSPEGFKHLSHAYTLFAESYKKGNLKQRGRFNFGEKWVIAAMKSCYIVTTKGTVVFGEDGRHMGKGCRSAGTLFCGLFSSTKEEVAKALSRLRTILPDQNVRITINGEQLQSRVAVQTFEATLPTVRINEAGELIQSEAKTEVFCYEVLPGERPTVYELGIPVVALDEKGGDPWHYDVRQKVPLSLNRDNVKPRFLKMLRTEALNATHSLLSPEQAKSRAVTEALEQAVPEAVTDIMTKRYGEKRAIYDPSDIESAHRLAGEGFTIIPGGSFDKATWDNIKVAKAALPSGTLRPTPKPYQESGRPVKLLDPEKMTMGMRRMEQYIKLLARKVCEKTVTVTWVNDFSANFFMCCGPTGSLDINVAKLGYAWFDAPPATRWEVDDILLDEFGHFRESNHLSENYYRTLREFGAKIGVLKLTKPELFAEFR